MGKHELRNLRIILIIFMVLGPLSAYSTSKNTDNLYNPMWIRIVISGFLALYFLGTIYSEFVKNNSRKITLFVIYFLTYFQIYLAYFNNYNIAFINGYVFMAILGILYIKSHKQVFIYSIFTFLFLVGLYFYLISTDYALRGGSVIGMGITNLLFTMLKVYILNKELSVIQYSKELTESEKKYKNLLESAPDAIISIDNNGCILGLNKKAINLFQFTEEELINKNIKILIPEQYGVNAQLSNISYTDNIITLDLGEIGDVFAIKKDGNQFPIEISLSSVIESDDKHVIAIIRDISKRLADKKEFDEIKLILQEKELAEKVSKAKSEFISKMSHEIRTPLNGIHGFTNILLKENISPEHKKYIENIKFSTELLNVLINDILDNTNLETGNITLENNEINIRELTENVLETFRIRLKEKSIKAKINFSESITDKTFVPVGDMLRISQIIMNLLSNAIKFSYESSEIEIEIGLKEILNDKIEFSFEITNIGIGIPKEKIKDIFQPFVQVSTAISKQYGGNGLGLSIVKHLIDKMGGNISASSDEKTRFSFKIPLDKIQHVEAKSRLQQNIDFILPENMRILVVEDNLMNQYLVDTILNKRKIKHEIVENGKQALVSLENNRFDVILMDLMMPEMDGITCAKIIRKDLKLDLKIIALTADVKPTLNSEIDLIFDGYLKKPFEENVLMELIYEFSKK